MSDQIRVVFFYIGSGAFGGGSKMLLRLLQSINKNKFDLLLLSNVEDELCQRAKNHGVKVKIIPFHGSLDTYNKGLLSESHLIPFAGMRILQFNVDVWQYLSEADVIWCKNLRAVLTLLPHALVTQIPTIWNIGLGLKSSGKIKYLNSVALRNVDHIFIESEEQAERIFTENQYNRYRSKFTVFHKGIDTEKFDPEKYQPTCENDALRIGTAASLTPRKGLEYLIDAVPQILEEHENVTITIAGEAPEGFEEYEKQLRKQVNQHAIGDHVEFLGWVDDMPAYLNTLDVFVLPSLNEGIPGSVREALAMELPVIATDVGGTSDVVIDGKTGHLVEPANTEQIVERSTQLLSDESERQMLGIQGRRHMLENFSIDSYIRDYEEYLNDIVKNKVNLYNDER